MKFITKAVMLSTMIPIFSLSPAVFAQTKNYRNHLEIKIERVNGSTDDTVRIRLEIKNVSQEPVEIYQSSPAQDYAVSAIGPDGKPAKPTKLKEKLDVTVSNGSHVLITLPPQQTISSDWNISDWIDLSRSGTHRINVTRNFDTIGETVASNTLELRVP